MATAQAFRECVCEDKASSCRFCSVELELDVSCPPDQDMVSVTQDDIQVSARNKAVEITAPNRQQCLV